MLYIGAKVLYDYTGSGKTEHEHLEFLKQRGQTGYYGVIQDRGADNRWGVIWTHADSSRQVGWWRDIALILCTPLTDPTEDELKELV